MTLVGDHRRPRGGPRTLTAASAQATTKRGQVVVPARMRADDADLWRYYQQVGVVHYGIGFKRANATRARFLPARVGEPGNDPEPVDPGDPTDREVARIFEELDGGRGRIAEAVGEAIVHLDVTGVAWPVYQVRDGEDRLTVYGTEEVSRETARLRLTGDILKSGGWQIDTDGDDGDLLAVVWRPSPQDHSAPDSPLRSVVAECEMLVAVRLAMRAGYLSRVPAGIITVPDELNPFPPSTDGTNPLLEDMMTALTAAIKDPGSAAAVAPYLLSGPGDVADKVRHVDLGRRVYPEDIELAQSLTRQIATGLDIPAELFDLGGMNHWCVDADTEILTRRGWARHDAVSVGDEVLACDMATGMTRWTPVRDMYRAAVVDEPMVRVQMGGHSSLTTPGHRWPTAEGRWVTSGTLRDRDHLLTGAPSEAPAVAKWSDAMVELAAWLWTEGWVSRDGNAACIAQSVTVNPGRVARIRAALTAEFGPDSFTERRQAAALGQGTIIVFGLRAWTARALVEACGGKRIRPEFVESLTAAQLALFIDVSCQGDGQHYRGGKLDIWQKDPSMLDAFELAGILAGYAVSRSDDGRRVNLASKTTVRPVKAHRAAVRAGREPLIRDETYTGTIWCPTTDEHTWVARRDGQTFITGNSAWLVDASAYRAHIDPTLRLALDGITRRIFRPLLQRRLGWSEEEAEQYTLWRDISDLVASPNRVADAVSLFDRGIIAAAPVRRVAGYDETDAPGGDTSPGPTPSEPSEPPRVVEPGPPQTDQPGAAVVSLVAALTPTLSGAGLADIDRSLLVRLHEASRQAIRHALDRAGARARNRLRGAADLRLVTDGWPNRDVCARLGRQTVVERLALAEADLVTEEDFRDFEADAQRMLDRAVASSAEEAGRLGGVVSRDRGEEAESVDRAVAALVAAALASTVSRLFTPDADQDPAESGEVAEPGGLDPATIMDAVTVAGGGAGAAVALGALLEAGVGNGRRVTDWLRDGGVVTVGNRWVYGDRSLRATNFEPHLALDGIEFVSWEDDRLSVTGPWPRVSHYRPQDHRGCLCGFERVLTRTDLGR